MKNHRQFLVALILLSPLPALAWDSEVHTALIQLTHNIRFIPGFWESEHSLVLAQDAGEKCYTYRTETLSKAPARRIFLDLVCGADEPDNEKKWRFWKNTPHQEQAEKLAVDEFNAAVNTYRQAGSKGASAYAEAANHLGRSIHYLQDLTDFTKGMADRSEGRDIRKRANKMAQAYLNQWQTTKHYPPELMEKLKGMRAEIRSEPAPQTPAELVNGALQQRAEMSAIAREFLADPKEQGSRDYKINVALFTALAGTIVIQEYWVDLYLNYIGVQR